MFSKSPAIPMPSGFNWNYGKLVLLLVLAGCPAGCKPSTPVDEISVESSQAGEELPPLDYSPTDWPCWRGVNQDGKTAVRNPPAKKWTTLENVLWKQPIPGKGHSSPAIVGSQIFLTTADQATRTQSVLALDRDSGQLLWQTEIHRGHFPDPATVHAKSTHATPTVACDGERVFALFLNDNKAIVTALSLQGEKQWQTVAGPYLSRFGFGSSPVLYKSFVIVSSEHSGGGYLAAIHRKSGQIAWRIKRPQNDSWSSPVVCHIKGKDQLILSGAGKVTSYNPANGQERWSVTGTSESTCGTAVCWNDLVFASGGFPERQTVCVKVNNSPKVLWTHRERFYIPSMITFDAHLFGVTDKGVAYCWEAESGKQKWKARLPGQYAASPIIDGDQIIVINEQAFCLVLQQNTRKLEKVAQKLFGKVALATPAISGDRLYLRVAEQKNGNRQEYLHCIAR